MATRNTSRVESCETLKGKVRVGSVAGVKGSGKLIGSGLLGQCGGGGGGGESYFGYV